MNMFKYFNIFIRKSKDYLIFISEYINSDSFISRILIGIECMEVYKMPPPPPKPYSCSDVTIYISRFCLNSPNKTNIGFRPE